jgi:hypothetical protein
LKVTFRDHTREVRALTNDPVDKVCPGNHPLLAISEINEKTDFNIALESLERSSRRR